MLLYDVNANSAKVQSALILSNYENVNSDWNYVSFASTNATAGVNSTSLSTFLKESGSGLLWRYSGPPNITSSFKGKSNVSCSFVACLDSP